MTNAINGLKKNKAPGPDQITNDMLIQEQNYLVQPMTDCYNNMLKEKEEIPESWNNADIISIYKGKGDRHSMNNQRGISLTSSVFKCLEKVIGNRIDENKKKYTTNLQGGGKKGEATEEYILMIKTIIDITKKGGKHKNDHKRC